MLSVCQVNSPNCKKDEIIGPNIPLTLPAILGRGPLLKCSETKVSRRHASIDWDDDGITIQALHSNPTLVMVSGVMSSLSKGESLTLHHGDLFGLLNDAAWYRICLVDNKDASLSISNADCSTSKNLQADNSYLKNCASIAKKKETTGQGSCESTAEGQATNNAFENSRNKKLLPVQTDACATTSIVPADDELRKVGISSQLDEPKMNLNLNGCSLAAAAAAAAAAPNLHSATDGVTNNDATAGNDKNELATTPSKKARNEGNSTRPDLVQAAVSHRVRALPSWMKNLEALPSPAAGNSGTGKGAKKQSTFRARGNRDAAPSNKKGNGLADGIDAALEKRPASNRKRGKKSVPHSPEETAVVSDSESKPSTMNSSPVQQSSPTNTSPAKDCSANSTPSKGSSAISTPVKQSDRRGKQLHYMSDSESEDEAITTSPAKPTKAVPKAEHKKRGVSTVAKVRKPEEVPSSISASGADDASGNGCISKSTVNALSDSSSEEEIAPSTSNATGIRTPGMGLTAAANTAPSAAVSKTTDAAAGGDRRKSCPFGASCYRRNPQHKRDEAHPGDADYISGPESDAAGADDDDRPECEFGVDCYRKNPDHRRQYKHTRLPQPQRRVKRKARAAQKRNADDVGDSDDSYDYDDPFLNDDSSDDYAPTDSDSESERLPSQPLDEEEKRDLKRMKKEAKKFVKGDQ